MTSRIPKNPKTRAALQKYWELRKVIAEVEELELANSSTRAAANKSLVHTFYDEVTGESIRTCLADLGAWSREFPNQPLTIIFNSPGGYVTEGLALFDFLLHLRLQGHHLTTVALGQASSMGAILLQAGDVRVMGPHALLLIHEVSGSAEGKLSDMKENVRQLDREQQKLLEILSKRSIMSQADIEQAWHKTEWWLDADEAIKLGFADEKLGADHSLQHGGKLLRSTSKRRSPRAARRKV